MTNFILIDPPVRLGSAKKDIELWIRELQKMEQTAEVQFEMERAERWLSESLIN